MNFACVVYRVLMLLYSARFRAEFGDQMTQTFCDHFNDARQSRDGVGLSFWCGVLADALPSALHQRALVWRDAPFASLLSALMGVFVFLVAYSALVTLSLRLPHPPIVGIAFPITLATLLVGAATLSLSAVRMVGQYAHR